MKKKEICCIGAGYVGGPTMAVIASKCPNLKINVVDINPERIKQWNGDLSSLPIFEPGLKEIVAETRNKNLFFSTKIDDAIRSSDIIFMAVNTPTKDYGEGKGMATDLTYVEECARRISKVSNSSKIVVEKSTAPIGTAEKIKSILNSNKKNITFEVISNPEFLAEGTAINDLTNPDRVLIGGDQTKSGKGAIKEIVEIYNKWVPKKKIITTNLWSSELSKLASNAFLAQRVSSINSLSALCEKSGADIKEVSIAVGKDSRIGKDFLKASVGFGGSCFKKDILNLVYLCKHYGIGEVADYWNQVLKINDYQKHRFADRIEENLNGSIDKKQVTILGWAFKKNTNDSRESASIEVTYYLLKKGALINIYDPLVDSNSIFNDLKRLMYSNGNTENQIKSYLSRVKIYNELYKSIQNSCCISILTEWDEFKELDWTRIIKNPQKPILIADGRNILDSNKVLKFIDKYISIGT